MRQLNAASWQHRDTNIHVDVHVAWAKLKERLHETWTRVAPFFAADEVSLVSDSGEKLHSVSKKYLDMNWFCNSKTKIAKDLILVLFSRSALKLSIETNINALTQ